MEDPINLDQSIMNWLEDIESEIPGSLVVMIGGGAILSATYSK